MALLNGAGRIEGGKRVYLGDLPTKNEAWLRDTLFANPDLLPIQDIDATFGPLVPLCRELRTDAGIIDAAFINEFGRLTIVECKRWANPQSRREVVAQTLDYVAALSRWSYADLQRQVSAALKQTGNVPFDLVRKHGHKVREQDFVDGVSRSLQEARILVLIAGDGVREGLQSITDLIGRSATMAFSFGLVEVALHQFKGGQLAIQPRILAQSEIISRQIAVLGQATATATLVDADDEAGGPGRKGSGEGKDHLKEWWAPLLKMKFDDPNQSPPQWTGTNNLTLRMPHPGIQIKAWATTDGGSMGVYVRGTTEQNRLVLRDFINRHRRLLEKELPPETRIEPKEDWAIVLSTDQAMPDQERKAWLKRGLNTFVNVLRPRLSAFYESPA
jgi:hypothetical protein